MIKWIKDLRAMVKDYNHPLGKIAEMETRLSRRITWLEKLIKDRTDIAVDISADRRAPHSVIIIGRYGKQDFVQTYSFHDTNMNQLISQLRLMCQHGQIKRIDGPPGIKAAFLSELHR